MNKEIVIFSIIDKNKKAKSTKSKNIVFSALLIFVGIILYFPSPNTLTFDPIFIKMVLILLAGILVPIGLTYVMKIPSKGSIEINNNLISISIRKKKNSILVSTDSQLTLYEFPSDDEGTTYIIDFIDKGSFHQYELDIVFTNEKEELELIKNKWRNLNIDFKEKNTPPNNMPHCKKQNIK